MEYMPVSIILSPHSNFITYALKKVIRTSNVKVLSIFSIILFIFVPAFLFAQVDTAWIRIDPPTIIANCIVSDMAIDDSGNVYVTGGNVFTSGLDFLSLKYTTNGVLIWEDSYNGPGNAADLSRAVAVDSSGNVYVAGLSRSSISYSDCVTIKYYPGGTRAWSKRYTESINDGAYDIGVDNSGNVYVTGSGQSLSGENLDYITIKYYSNGDTAWVKKYNGSGDGDDYSKALVLDDSGNIFITGISPGSNTDDDYTTIKYYPNGDTAWTRRYNGSGNGPDKATSLAIDSMGDVYVTGYSMDLDSSYSITTIKYNTNGVTLWTNTISEPLNIYAYDISVDNSANAYITGGCQGSINDSLDYITIKYYPSGDTAWVRIYDGPGGQTDAASSIALDDLGNVYVTGRSYGSGSSLDFTTIKYDPNGNIGWIVRYNGPGNGIDRAKDIAVDHSGNVYVSGESMDIDSKLHYATIKYIQTISINETEIPQPLFNLQPEFDPNPACNYIIIRTRPHTKHIMIKIFDISGKKIKEVDCANPGPENRISLTDINPGIYFVQVDNIAPPTKLVIIE